MTVFEVGYEITVKRADGEGEDDEILLNKPEEVVRFLRGYIESMEDWYFGEEYTVTIHRLPKGGK